MSVTVEELQPFVEKEVVLHKIKEDGSMEQLIGTIKAATIAGVPFKTKGKAGIDLIQVKDIEEVALAPSKEKSVTQKKLAIVEMGNARQHLIDRHGVELSWAKNASEKEAFDWHATLDHTNLGHVHVDKTKDKDESKDEREQALSDESPAEANA